MFYKDEFRNCPFIPFFPDSVCYRHSFARYFWGTSIILFEQLERKNFPISYIVYKIIPKLNIIKRRKIMVLSDYNATWDKDFAPYPDMRLEYGPLESMWKVVRYIGINIPVPHFFAKSGYGTFFLYDIDRFWVYDIMRERVIHSASELCGAETEVLYEPESLDTALSFIERHIDMGRLVYMSWFEPFVVFGLSGGIEHPRLHWHNFAFAPQGTIWGRDELEQQWWKWADFQGAHSLIAVTGKKEAPSEAKIVETLCEGIVKNMQQDSFPLDPPVAMGLAGYTAYARDLRDPSIDFMKKDDDGEQRRISWFCFALYSQWTQLYALKTYLNDTVESMDKGKREPVRSAVKYLNDAFEHWLEWERLIGRHPDRELYEKRIRDIEVRKKAADAVDAARESIEKVVQELGNILE